MSTYNRISFLLRTVPFKKQQYPLAAVFMLLFVSKVFSLVTHFLVFSTSKPCVTHNFATTIFRMKENTDLYKQPYVGDTAELIIELVKNCSFHCHEHSTTRDYT